MSRWTWGGSLLLLLASIGLAPAAAQDPGPCDPIKIDLTTLFPDTPPPPPGGITIDPVPQTMTTLALNTVDADGNPLVLRWIGMLFGEPSPAIFAVSLFPGGWTLMIDFPSPVDSITSGAEGTILFTTSTADDMLRVYETAPSASGTGFFALNEVAAIPVGNNAINATAIPNSTWVAVLLRDTNEIQLVNWGTPAPAANVVLAGDPIAVAALEDGQHVVVTLEGGTVVLVDLQTLSVVSTVPLGGDLSDVSAYEGRVFVTDRSTDTVTVMDAETFTVIDVVSTNATEPARVVSDRTGPASTKFVFVISSDTFVSVLDGDETSPTYLQEVMQIVLEGAASAVVVGPEGTDLDTFVGRSETKTLLAVAPGCLTSAPKLSSLSPASGIPGSTVALTGAFSADTKFIVHYSGAPMAYLAPTSMSADLTTATVEVPLGLGANLAFGISATRSSQEAVLVKGNYYRTAPTPFHTTDPVVGAQSVIAGLQGVLSAGGLSLQAKKAINLAIEQINKANAQLAKGHFAEALNHLANAFAKMQQAIAKGANLGDLPRRLVELAQLLVFQKLQALTSTLGAGSPLLAAAQAAFDAGRAKLLAGDLAGAMASFITSGSSMGNAVQVARTLSRAQTEPLMAAALDAAFDASERLQYFAPYLNLSSQQSKLFEKAIDQLGPKNGVTLLDTALGDFARPDFVSALGHVKNAIKRMEDITASGKDVRAVAEDLAMWCRDALRRAATATESRVGPFDEKVILARARAQEAKTLSATSLSQSMTKVIQGFEALSLYTTPETSIGATVAPLEVPNLLLGSTTTFKYQLNRSPNAPGYFRLTIHINPLVATVAEGLLPSGTYTSAWDGTNLGGLSVAPGNYVADFCYLPLFISTSTQAEPPVTASGGAVCVTAGFTVTAPPLPPGVEPTPPPANTSPGLLTQYKIELNMSVDPSDDIIGKRKAYNSTVSDDPDDAPVMLCRIKRDPVPPPEEIGEPKIMTGFSDHVVQPFVGGQWVIGTGEVRWPVIGSAPPYPDPIPPVPDDGTPVTFIISGKEPSEVMADTSVYMVVGTMILLPTGDGIYRGGIQPVTVVRADLDVDSDNNNGAIGAPDRTTAEDDIENVEGDAAKPGKYVCVADADNDHDGVPDYADGLKTAQFDNEAGGVLAFGSYTHMVLEIPKPIDLTKVRIRFTYSASDPAEATRQGAGTIGDPHLYSPATGYLRLWRAPSDRDSAGISAGGDFIKPGVVYTWQQIREFEPFAFRVTTIGIEGTRRSDSLADQQIKVEIDPNGEVDEPGFIGVDVVRVTMIRVDLDIDSDNTNGLAVPDRNPLEDHFEDIEGNADRQGKYVCIDSGDVDNDGVPDFADGFNKFGNEGAGASPMFTPIVLELPEPLDLQKITLKFEYSASDPAHVSRTGNGTPADPHVYYLPSGLGSGGLRIWKRDGPSVRNMAEVDAGGDYVESEMTYEPSDLGNGRTITLYVEAVSAFLPAEPIRVLLSPVGSSTASNFICRDVVRTSAYEMKFLEIRGGRKNTVGNFAQESDPRKPMRLFVDTRENWDGGHLAKADFDLQRVQITCEMDLLLPVENLYVRWELRDPDDPATHADIDADAHGGDNTGNSHEGGGGHWFTKSGNYTITYPAASDVTYPPAPAGAFDENTIIGKANTLILPVPADAHSKSSVFFNFTDDGGDNFAIRAVLVYNRSTPADFTDDLDLCSLNSNTLTVWRKRFVEVYAMAKTDDVQATAAGTAGLPVGTHVIDPGTNGVLETVVAAGDVVVGNHIEAGPDGVANTAVLAGNCFPGAGGIAGVQTTLNDGLSNGISPNQNTYVDAVATQRQMSTAFRSVLLAGDISAYVQNETDYHAQTAPPLVPSPVIHPLGSYQLLGVESLGPGHFGQSQQDPHSVLAVTTIVAAQAVGNDDLAYNTIHELGHGILPEIANIHGGHSAGFDCTGNQGTGHGIIWCPAHVRAIRNNATREWANHDTSVANPSELTRDSD